MLVIDEMGKNISGAGFDPNITGRNRRTVQWNYGPLTKKIVILGLTPETNGNATGVGGADIITMRLFREIDIPSTYANIITSMNLDGGAIPMVMNTEQEAIQLAVKTVVRVKAPGLPHRAHQEHPRTGADPGFRAAAGGSTRPPRPVPDRLPACALDIRRARPARAASRRRGALRAGCGRPLASHYPRACETPAGTRGIRSAVMRKTILLIGLLLIAVPASAQTTKREIRKACSAEAKAKDLKGEEYKTFRNECLKAKKL